MSQTITSFEDAKKMGREKLQLAIDNFKQAELEGAERVAPDTYNWAKHKIYESKKLILKHPSDLKIINEASVDASAASAKLLSLVRSQLESTKKIDSAALEKNDQEAIKNLMNEGGPVI